MTRAQRRIPTFHEERADADRQTASLAAVALLLFLVVVGLYLVRTLRSEANVEDCLLSGRRNCDAALVQHVAPQAW